ncbi:Na(+)-translocating NADH-quinone reductase subunit F [Bienertia sinuspersici]
MDPCPFLKIVIGNLAIKFSSSSSSSRLSRAGRYGPIIPQDGPHPEGQLQTVSACFNLTKSDLETLIKSKSSTSTSISSASRKSTRLNLNIDVYSSKSTGCGFGSSGKLMGTVLVPLELSQQVLEGKTSTMMQNGWVLVGEKKKKGLNPQLYLSVKAQPDPRFVFEFDGEPECSPQVFQVQGNIKQPVFTCNSAMSEASTSRSWLSTLKSDKDHQHHHQSKERKGWSITVHDLSGSPVAAASMVTPFVPSQGSDKVSKSNPGAWLILRPGDGTWKPWGRLEAWRERAGPTSDSVGHRFELLPEAMGPSGITLAQASIPARPGGKFNIDVTTGPSPSGSPNSSFDFGSWNGSGSASSSGSEPGPGIGWWPGLMYRGFVMSSTIGGDGKGTKPMVEVGSQHVSCTEDAAAFVALAAAMDLSMDACRPFSQKLRKELRQQSGEFVV